MTEAEQIAKLRTALQTLMGDIDFRNHCCSMMSPVGAAVNPQSFTLVDEALECSKPTEGN